MKKYLKNLINNTRHIKMSLEEQEKQRRSFAYGNTRLHNKRITKKLIALAAERILLEKNKLDER